MMKRILLLILAVILISGCQKDNNVELIFDKNSVVNCIFLLYEFEDGTKIYTDYTNIKYKAEKIEIPVIEALENGLLNFDDIKNYKEFKIFSKDDPNPLECIN